MDKHYPLLFRLLWKFPDRTDRCVAVLDNVRIADAKYVGRDTSKIAVNSKNWSYAFTNSNIVSQPVVYQSNVSGTWTTGEGDAYKRGIKLYIRDIYGNGIDKTGESFSTSEKGKYPTPSTTKGIGHIYLSSQDVKAVDGKYNFVYIPKQTNYLKILDQAYGIHSKHFGISISNRYLLMGNIQC